MPALGAVMTAEENLPAGRRLAAPIGAILAARRGLGRPRRRDRLNRRGFVSGWCRSGRHTKFRRIEIGSRLSPGLQRYRPLPTGEGLLIGIVSG